MLDVIINDAKRMKRSRSAIYVRFFPLKCELFHLLCLTEAAQLLLITNSQETVKLEHFIHDLQIR